MLRTEFEMMIFSKYLSLREMGEEDRDTKRGVQRLEREELTRDGKKSVCLSYGHCYSYEMIYRINI